MGDGRIETELKADPGGVEVARRHERERIRRSATIMYWADIERGLSHGDAWHHVMHEVRKLSEDDLWGWVKESAGFANRRLPVGFPAQKPSVEQTTPRVPEEEGGPSLWKEGVPGHHDGTVLAVDDSDTALAPEEGRWEFDDSVTAAFDDMLQRSIPNYKDMREFVTRAAVWHVNELRTGKDHFVRVADLGASRGTALQPIVDSVGAFARYDAYELAEPMVKVLEERFAGLIQASVLKVHQRDLRNGMMTGWPYGVVLSVLTLQFIPIEYRQRLLRSIHEALQPGGAFILVEKVLGATAELDSMEVDLYYDTKRGQGYTQEAIDRKRLSLEGVLVPLTARMNEDLLRDAGFAAVDCCWSWANFRGWVAQKR